MSYRLSAATAAALVLLTASAGTFAERKTGWQPGITIAPYGWLAGMDGTLGSSSKDINDESPINFPPRLDVSTDEEWTDIGFMLYSEWRGERWTAFFDSVWANVSQDGDVKLGNLLPSSDAEVSFDGNIYQAGIGYLLVDQENTFVTVYGGGRYYDIESEVSARGGILPNKITASTTRTWSDAVFGVRMSHNFGERWKASLMADYGFGDSDSVWQAFGTVGYGFSWGSIVAGYRHMSLDFETPSYKLDLYLTGPVLGASFTF